MTRPLARRVAAALVVVLACGGNNGTGPPPPGNYTVVVGDNWTYSSDAQLMAANLFNWGASGVAGPIDNYVDLVNDATFGQVVRITQPLDSTEGFSPQMHKVLPVPLDKVWWRFRIRFSVGWTAVGSGGVSTGNAYKVAHMYMPGGGAAGRTRVDIENTTQINFGFGFPGRSYTQTAQSGNWSGTVNTEFTDGQWYEFIFYHEKLGVTTGRTRWWRRKLTQGGTIVDNPFFFAQIDATGATSADTFPQIREIAQGINKNRSNDQTQYIYWGPWEVVDGSIYPNPFGVGP